MLFKIGGEVFILFCPEIEVIVINFNSYFQPGWKLQTGTVWKWAIFARLRHVAAGTLVSPTATFSSPDVPSSPVPARGWAVKVSVNL